MTPSSSITNTYFYYYYHHYYYCYYYYYYYSFFAIRWMGHSDCPLSSVHGKEGDKFIIIEASSSHATRKG